MFASTAYTIAVVLGLTLGLGDADYNTREQRERALALVTSADVNAWQFAHVLVRVPYVRQDAERLDRLQRVVRNGTESHLNALLPDWHPVWPSADSFGPKGSDERAAAIALVPSAPYQDHKTCEALARWRKATGEKYGQPDYWYRLYPWERWTARRIFSCELARTGDVEGLRARLAVICERDRVDTYGARLFEEGTGAFLPEVYDAAIWFDPRLINERFFRGRQASD